MSLTQSENSLVCPQWLLNVLRKHRDAYEPEYDGHLTDHFPMMLLAMHGLGTGRRIIESNSASYVRRLDRAPSHPHNTITRFDEGIGKRAAYRGLISFLDESIARRGVAETLAEYLPKVLSGWVRHAFHGTIRLAYGIRFDVESEIAAGLAYLATAGTDERLENVARNATLADRFVWPPPIDVVTDRFDDRYEEVMLADTFAVHTHIIEDNKVSVAEAALDIFNHTRGFFALHMVTGTHAFDICTKAIEIEADGMMNAGLAAAYLTIGAPMFVPDAKPKPLRMDFAHDVKIAFSCSDQARRLNSEAYQQAFNVYGRKFS